MPDATRQKLFLYDLWFLYGWGFFGGFLAGGPKGQDTKLQGRGGQGQWETLQDAVPIP